MSVATPYFDGSVRRVHERKDVPIMLSRSGIEFAYLPTDSDLGVLLEIFSGMPGAGKARTSYTSHLR